VLFAPEPPSPAEHDPLDNDRFCQHLPPRRLGRGDGLLRTGDAVLDRDVIVILIEYSMPPQLWRPVRVDQAGLLEQVVIRRDFAPRCNAAVICFAMNFSSAAGERCTSRQKQKRCAHR
jgi:hypothetical protein